MDFTEVTAGQSKEMPSKKVIYGVPKIGKSRFASQFPDPFFINIEGGLDYIGKAVRATPKLHEYDEVIAWLKHIYENDEFKASTIVIDSMDWAEALATRKVEKANGNIPITNKEHKPYAYGNGTLMVSEETIKILRWLDAIHTKKGTGALIIAHSQVRTVDLPNQEPYSRHELKLGKAVAAKIMEWADLVLFADYSFHVTKEGKTSEPKPMIYAGGSAAYVGGGRMKLSKEIPLDYKLLEKEITNG
jgi:hypothetical protein